MPVVTVGGKTPIARPQRLPVYADDAALHLADVAWTLARIDAHDLLDQAETVLQIAERVQNGDRWMRANAADHPKRYANGGLLYRLYRQQQLEQVTLRCLMRSCWQRCCETYALVQRGGLEVERRILGPVEWDEHLPPVTLWRRLVPDIEPPDDRGYILPRTGAALWELDDLRKALQRRTA